MIKNCEYTESTDTMVRDRLVFGIRDTKVQSQLLRIDVDRLTLEKAFYLIVVRQKLPRVSSRKSGVSQPKSKF